MATRLLVVAHPPTAGSREWIFGDDSVPNAAPSPDPSLTRWTSGPETPCRLSAARFSDEVDIVADLAGPDFGAWTGRTLTDVGTEDEDGVGAWLSDPFAAPHGGESLATMITRVGRCVDGVAWPDERSGVVVTPLVARGLIVHALGAPPEVIFRTDVAPAGRVLLSRRGASWRFQELTRPRGRR